MPYFAVFANFIFVNAKILQQIRRILHLNLPEVPTKDPPLNTNGDTPYRRNPFESVLRYKKLSDFG